MKTVIIDDHNIIIEGIEMLLGFEKDIKILKSYNDGYDFLDDLRTNKIVPVYDLIEKIGVEGYLSKKISRKELVAALNDVKLGYIHLSEEASRALSEFKKRIFEYPEIKLSAREKEIVALMMKGNTNREIAEKLFISESTVETHRKNVYRKTDAHSLPKLIQIVQELNLLESL